jgi:hypothetical protein
MDDYEPSFPVGRSTKARLVDHIALPTMATGQMSGLRL